MKTRVVGPDGRPLLPWHLLRVPVPIGAPQKHPEVGGTDVDPVALGDALPATQVKPSQSSRLEQVCEASLDRLARLSRTL
jgi:hypothetical protein